MASLLSNCTVRNTFFFGLLPETQFLSAWNGKILLNVSSMFLSEAFKFIMTEECYLHKKIIYVLFFLSCNDCVLECNMLTVFHVSGLITS